MRSYGVKIYYSWLACQTNRNYFSITLKQRFWEIASLPIGFLTPSPFALLGGCGTRSAQTSSPNGKGDSPLFFSIIRKKAEKRGLSPFLVALEERIPMAESSMVATAISQNLCFAILFAFVYNCQR
jgi:hypothetical protein